MKYSVRALSPDHGVSQLELEAVDEADARRQVGQRGLFVAAVQLHGQGAAGRWLGASAAKPRLSLVLFSQELLALLEAGLGIVESFEALLEKEGAPEMRQVLSRLLAGLRDGKRLSAVMAEQPALFNPLYLGAVRAAEGTSDLPGSLRRFIAYQTRIDAVRAKVVSAAIYPAILLSVGAAVSLFLLGYVVPRFAEVYQGAGRSLPWMSALMLGWGQFVAAHVQVLGMAGAALVPICLLGWRRIRRLGGWPWLLGRVPGVADRVRVYQLSRLYLTLGMLLEGGIPLVPAMQTIGSVVAPELRGRLDQARQLIQSGMPLSEAFRKHALTTPISLRMLSVGERSGDIGAMLTQSAAFYDGEISRWIDRFMRSFEPLLMTAIGLMVGVIVVLLYMPIFDLAGNF